MTPNAEWGLDGKVAIVTGGGAVGDGIGNGRAAAILLGRSGAHVLVVDRDLALAEKTVAMIAAEGGSAVAASYDVTSSKQCEAMVADAMTRWGRLDCLDNNVGIGSRATVVEETEENWSRVMQVNVDTMFLTSKHAIPAMIRGGGGAIVNISSISAIRPRGLTAYSVSKGAAMYTPMVYARGMTEQARDLRRQASVLKQEGTGWDIGGAVRFLLSAQAKYITGHCLMVDGGASLVGPSRASQ